MPSSASRRAVFGGQAEELLDRGAGPAARAQLEHLAEQHQRDDDRRRLEVDRDLAAVLAERGGEDAGEQRGDQAVDVGDADAEPDQREHVEAPVPHRLDGAHEERPGRPEADRRREQRARATYARAARAEREIGWPGSMSPIASTTSGTVSDGGEPEAPRHVAQLGVLLVLRRRPCAARAPCRRSGSCPARRGRSPGASGRSTRSSSPARRHRRLERHAALRAGARPVLRGPPGASGRCRPLRRDRRCRCRRLDLCLAGESCRLGAEFFAAAGAAESDLVTVMVTRWGDSARTFMPHTGSRISASEATASSGLDASL